MKCKLSRKHISFICLCLTCAILSYRYGYSKYYDKAKSDCRKVELFLELLFDLDMYRTRVYIQEHGFNKEKLAKLITIEKIRSLVASKLEVYHSDKEAFDRGEWHTIENLHPWKKRKKLWGSRHNNHYFLEQIAFAESICTNSNALNNHVLPATHIYPRSFTGTCSECINIK